MSFVIVVCLYDLGIDSSKKTRRELNKYTYLSAALDKVWVITGPLIKY